MVTIRAAVVVVIVVVVVVAAAAAVLQDGSSSSYSIRIWDSPIRVWDYRTVPCMHIRA